MRPNWVAFSCLLLVPIAEAQGEPALTARIDDGNRENDDSLNQGRLRPDRLYHYAVIATVRCADVATGGRLTITPENPFAEFSVVLVDNPKVTMGPGECVQASEEFRFDVTLLANRTAPAFKTVSVNYRLTLERSSPGGVVAEVDVSHQIIIDYLPIMEYTPTKYFAVAPPRKDVVFVLKYANFGNGESRIRASVDDASITFALPPPPVTVDSRAELGASAEFTAEPAIIVEAPGESGEIRSVTIRFNATSPVTAGGTLSDEQTLTLSVEARGSALPAPGHVEALILFSLALLLARRRLEY